MRQGRVDCGVRRCLLATVLAVSPAVSPPVHSQVRFLDVADASGIDFVLDNGATPEKHLVETMGGGLAVFDYDNDGRIDIFFTNGAALPSLHKSSERFWNRLYRNLGDMRFSDVSEQSGLEGAGFCTGATAGDYNNDGHSDLFVTCFPRNALYRNLGDGSFDDVTARAGIASSEWSIGGLWLDYDSDGQLDLFVVNYLDWTPAFDTFCGDPRLGVRSYCNPGLFDGFPNRLYRNRGDGTFEDVSRRAGIWDHVGKGMSAVAADADGDGDTDIFVTNDKVPNFLFLNLGDGTFEERALLSGAALQDHGKPVSGMGADFNDFDNDGLPDIVFSALSGESFPLFRNMGSGSFRDVTFRSGMGPLTHNLSGWGLALVDFDNDGWKDLFTANSHVNDTVGHFEAARYKLANSVFVNSGNGSFASVTRTGLDSVRAHRGAGFADFDEDGLVDVVVTSLGERIELWRNVTQTRNRWLGLSLVGTRSNRGGVGAMVRVGDQVSYVTSSTGYVSSSQAGVHFGVGELNVVPRATIHWPSGAVQTLEHLETNTAHEVREAPLIPSE